MHRLQSHRGKVHYKSIVVYPFKLEAKCTIDQLLFIPSNFTWMEGMGQSCMIIMFPVDQDRGYTMVEKIEYSKYSGNHLKSHKFGVELFSWKIFRRHINIP